MGPLLEPCQVHQCHFSLSDSNTKTVAFSCGQGETDFGYASKEVEHLGNAH